MLAAVAAYAFPVGLGPWVTAAFASGAFGVDLFFALSAYLITVLLLREKETRLSLDVKAFYLRRILRIWPLYFAFLAFAMLLSSLGFRSQHLTAPYVAGYLVLAGNWVYVLYGLPQSVTVPLWSISIEEQFYLLWPLAVRKCSRRTMAWIAVSLLILSNCARILFVKLAVPPHAIEYNTLARLDPIALGILLALVLGYKVPRISTPLRIALFLAGAATWIVVARYWELSGYLTPARGVPLGRPAVALASIAMLIAVLGIRGGLNNPVLIYLGKISYGLYVIHEFGLLVALKLNHDRANALTVIAGLLITILLAAISYRWLETPFLSLKKRFTHVASRSL